MAGYQAWVSVVGEMKAVLDAAYEKFPDCTSPSQAYRRALLDWSYNQQSDSKRGALRRLEEKLTTVDENSVEALTILRELLAILKGSDYDGDHA